MPGPVRNPTEAYQQLEAIMLRQMLQSSGAFRASSTPGAQLRTDMFVETLADAVAKAGGLGIARMLERQLGGDTPSGTPLPTRPGGTAGAPAGAAAGAPGDAHSVAAVGDFDDPNSEAPLAEDPSAGSIDDYQTGPARRPGSMRVPLQMPVPSPAGGNGEITSGFGRRLHPITGDMRFHSGVDLRAANGTPIQAAAPGVVRDAGHRGGYGNVVEIDHGNGTSTLYAHASKLLVDKGQRVEAGQPVALVGQTGQATGPHLHFELRRHDHPVNPTSAIAPSSIARALNRYRERAEVTGAGTPSSVGNGETKP